MDGAPIRSVALSKFRFERRRGLHVDRLTVQPLPSRRCVHRTYQRGLLVSSIKPIIVGYVETNTRPSVWFPETRFTGEEIGRCFANALTACWSAVIPPEHVVDEPGTTSRHSSAFRELRAERRARERPTRFFQQQINEIVARLRFGVVVSAGFARLAVLIGAISSRNRWSSTSMFCPVMVLGVPMA